MCRQTKRVNPTVACGPHPRKPRSTSGDPSGTSTDHRSHHGLSGRLVSALEARDGRGVRTRLLVVTLALAACETYVAPPRIQSLNVEAGIYDPARGPLEVKLSGAVDLATVSLDLFIDQRSREGELCVPDANGVLAEGCAGEALRVLGPCTPKSAPSERTDDQRTRFRCGSGGAIIAGAARDSLTLELDGRHTPFERYTVRLGVGLTGVEGADTGVPSEARFSVKSDVPLAPTDFAPGMFFAVVDIFEPIPAQFQFWFWIAVKPETGELRLYAADADPKDMSIDPKVNRDPVLWVADPGPPTGATLSAAGQVADVDGQRLLRIFPFRLLVTVPPVEAVSTEVNARVTQGEFPGAPPLTRDIIEGTMQSPGVFLGLDAERAALGAGRGSIALVRLTEAEQPPFASILEVGLTEDAVKNPSFDD